MGAGSRSTNLIGLRLQLVGAITALLISGCGGSDGSTQLAGSLSGLDPGTSVTLTNNNDQTLTVSSNGFFFFNGLVSGGTNYSVTVKTNPIGETCTVTNGTGTVGEYSEDVNNILVTCAAANGAIFGDVTGLASGASLTLLDTYGTFYNLYTDTLTITANGAFVFPTIVKVDDAYTVTITSQPAGQTCTLTEAVGVVPTKGGTNPIQVTCQ